MRVVRLRTDTDIAGWRAQARALALQNVPPEDVRFAVGGTPSAVPDQDGRFSVPRVLLALAELVAQARDADRFDLLYRLVWRARAGALTLDDATDGDLLRARRLAFAVRAEGHRLRAQLRYLPVDGRFIGWFEPAHYVLSASAPLLARRFPEAPVSVLTPGESAHWDAEGVRFGPGVEAASVPDDAALAAYWREYGAELLAAPRSGVDGSEAEPLAEEPWPPDRPAIGPVVLPGGTDPGIAQAAAEALGCERCPLFGPATQTVFGEGPAGAALLFVGEQPGDQEDVIGRPFVGPAGQVLDRGLAEAGIDRRAVYVTNAVKHFKFTPRGKRRIHQSPDSTEVRACAFWLDVERVRLMPRLIVLLGATAARAVLGRAVTIGRERGRPIRLSDTEDALVTVHPSFLLRLPDEAAKRREYRAFVDDLRLAARRLSQRQGSTS